MAKQQHSAFIVSLLIIICILSLAIATGARSPANEAEQVKKLIPKVDDKASHEKQTTWCIVKPSTGDEGLRANIDYCCQHVDCSIIKPGGSCYNPNNNHSHASVVMHLFYKANNKQPHTCNFTGSGLIISQDPSVGRCIYHA